MPHRIAVIVRTGSGRQRRTGDEPARFGWIHLRDTRIETDGAVIAKAATTFRIVELAASVAVPGRDAAA